MKFLISLAFCLLSFLNSYTQQSINFKTFTTTEGLPYGTINQIWKDKTGFIWLLGENGLHRFDGYEFISFRSKSNDPNSISSSSIYLAECDTNGVSFFATNTSISRFNESTRTFTNLIHYSSYLDVAFLARYENTIWSICENQLYKITNGGKNISKTGIPESLRGSGRITSYQMNDKMFIHNGQRSAFLDLKTGRFHLLKLVDLKGTEIKPSELFNPYYFKSNSGYGLSVKDRLFNLDEKAGVFRETSPRTTETDPCRLARTVEKQIGNNIYKIAPDNTFIDCNLQTGIVRKIKLYPNQTGLNNNRFAYGIISKGVGNTLWLAGLTSGILRIDLNHLETSDIVSFNSTNSNLKSNNFNAIFDADSNVVWMNSPGLGLIKGEKTSNLFHSFNPDIRFSDNIPANTKNVRAVIEMSPDKILIGTLVNMFYTSLMNPGNHKEFFNAPVATFIRDNENNVWFSCWGRKAVYKIEFSTGKIIPVLPNNNSNNYSDNFFRASWIDKKGNIYFGSTGNLLLKITKDINATNGFSMEMIQLNSGNIRINTIFKLCELNAQTLLIGSSTGVYEYNFTTRNVKRFDTDIEAARQFNTSDVRSLLFDDHSTLWIGTNGGGIYKYDTRNKKTVNYTSDNGLTDNSVYAIIQDSKKKLWISTNKGLCKFDPGANLFQSFSYKDGITFEEFNTGAAGTLCDGRIVFGGTGGYVIFHPDSIISAPKIPAPVLIRFAVNNQDVPLRSSYHLKHNENYISFQFASLSQFRNDELVYAYKLEGLDPDWTYCGRRRFTTYASLKPGNYTLKIKCTNYHGNWSTEELSIPVFIEIPWFQSWYFITLLALIITAIIYGWFRLRLNQRTKLLLIRDSIARDLHDEIGSNLSTISIYSEIAKENLSKNKEGIGPLLDKISAYTQTSQEAMSDIVWMIDSRNDNFENIILKMRSLASETIGASSGMQLHMQVDESIHQYRLGMKQRKNFYMIYKESLNNIIKYADCSNVWIKLNSDAEYFYLEIRDDGVGFEPGKTKGNGLIYMKKRAADIPAELEIISEIAKGTTIRLRFRH